VALRLERLDQREGRAHQTPPRAHPEAGPAAGLDGADQLGVPAAPEQAHLVADAPRPPPPALPVPLVGPAAG
jgi:hypothetical protein